ncbi:Ni/Fe hydrogenase subunit alpha [Candidatus Aerophobetes bacterium]|uniref:Ni/Fe hydrogenase subunit alpha n=1 Tax=Aerophobetes bacterium TaxID=2030807 RepID=A0A523TG43_UNCAE|nr:MAG: Ni/Fe hydrogenase subunit alpha [Candidatus Aerophobetes bacterium]
MQKSVVIDHLCRIEGNGGINVAIEDGRVVKVEIDIFEGARFLEALVVGRLYYEVPPILSRICAICSAVHTVTSLMAVEDAFETEPSAQTQLLRELLVQGGNIESHALHLFCLALPDFLGYSSPFALAEDYPQEVKIGLGLKKLGNTIQETVGGRAVHPVNAVLGGFGTVPTKKRLLELKQELTKGLEEALAAVESVARLRIPDFSQSPTLYAALASSSEEYSLFGDKVIFSSGESRKVSSYREICNETVVPHSHAKHSHFKGLPFMVGALARVMLNGHKLDSETKKAREKLGLGSFTENILLNNSAQAIEIIYSIKRCIQIIDQLLKRGIKNEKPVEIRPKAGQGTAALEAPRGILYHSYSFDNAGRITKADVITPTAQNLANMEKDFRALAHNFAGESKDGLRVKIEMVARAYDPCISCSVH